MQRVLLAAIVSILAILFVTCSDDTPTNQPPPTTGARTAIGVSAGTRSQATIGPAGGTIRSSDSAVMLVVPAGALGSQTDISIEPLTNTAPGGIGRGYRFLPAGLAFSMPATLTIGYGSANVTPSSAAIAFQGSDNIWQGLVAASHTDIVRHEVTASITHFTDFATYRRWFIVPEEVSVEVGKNVSFTVYTTDLPDIDEATIFSALPNPYVVPAADVKTWSVELIPGGDGIVGTIAVNGGNRSQATYTAPLLVPAKNPVEVEATIDRSDEGRPDLVVTASVKITSRDGGTGSTNIWEVQWECVDSTTCYTIVAPGATRRTMVYTGIDTITITTESGYPIVSATAGRLTAVTVRDFKKCPDPPDQTWSDAELVQQPVITFSEVAPWVEFEPPSTSIPTALIFRQAGAYQPGIGRNRVTSTTPPGNYHQINLDVNPTFNFEGRIRWPLQHLGGFDTTYTVQGDLGLKWILRVHGTVRKIP